MNQSELKTTLYSIIFGTESKAGKLFDVALICVIVMSVLILMLDSVVSVAIRFGSLLFILEWMFTIVFTIEFIVRLYCCPNHWRYLRSFYGVIDLCSVLPSYLALFFPGANYILVVRLLRVLRVFRVLKLARYLSEANVLVRSMMLSRRKVSVFFLVILILAVIFGSIMYVVEGPENGFTSIPTSIYWTIVTITTVGYGDITPQTALGQVVAAAVMLTGYSILTVPTGILTAELAMEIQRAKGSVVCKQCSKSGHDVDAVYCKYCGSTMNSH